MKMLCLSLMLLLVSKAQACSSSEEVAISAGAVKRENQVLVMSFSEPHDGGTCTYTLKDDDGVALIGTAFMIAKDRFKAARAASTSPAAGPMTMSFSDRIFRDSFSVGLDQLRGYAQNYSTEPKGTGIGATSKQDLEARLSRLETLLAPALTAEGQLTEEQASELGSYLSEISISHSYERTRSCRGTQSSDGENTAQKNLMEFLALGNPGNWGVRSPRSRLGRTRCGFASQVDYITDMSNSDFSFTVSEVAPSRAGKRASGR